MLYPSLFDSFFAPTRVIVVSEERLQAAERKAKQEQIEAVEVRINDLTKYRDELTTQLKELKSSKPGKDLDALDREPQSLEEALTGECDV
tara:strand:+ start:345 stop:614 length:270 start_codon:yes stop_codon:yes gene_type:complete